MGYKYNFRTRKMRIGDKTIMVERKERTNVYIESLGKSVERTIYTDGPNHYIVWKGKLTKVEFREPPIVRYRLKGEL